MILIYFTTRIFY